MPSSVGKTVEPTLKQSYRRKARKLTNCRVGTARRRAPPRAAEEVARHEHELARWLHAAPDGRPEAVDQEPGDPRRGRLPQPQLSLTVVEEEVARLVERDALEQLGEHGMTGARREPPVAGER